MCLSECVQTPVQGRYVKGRGQVIRWPLPTLAQSMRIWTGKQYNLYQCIFELYFNNFKAFRNTFSVYLARGRRNADGICGLEIILVLQPDWKIAADLEKVGKCLH